MKGTTESSQLGQSQKYSTKFRIYEKIQNIFVKLFFSCFKIGRKLDLKTKENFNSKTFLCLFNKFLKKMLIGSLEAI